MMRIRINGVMILNKERASNKKLILKQILRTPIILEFIAPREKSTMKELHKLLTSTKEHAVFFMRLT